MNKQILKSVYGKLMLLLACISCASCTFSFAVHSSSESNGESGVSSPSAPSVQSNPSAPSSDLSVSSKWNEMFTFDNVTIKSTSYAMGTKVSWLKYVDGIRYIQNEDETWERSDPTNAEFYDWRPYEPQFTYDESYNKYVGIDIIRTDEYADNWLNDVTISFNYDNQMSRIEIDHHLASVHFDYIYEFSGWGATE